MARAISALVSLTIFAFAYLAAKVWGWRAIGLGALGLLAVLLASLLVAGWRERRTRKERGGPSEWTARRWEREHVNGRLSWVEEVPYREGHYRFGVIVLGHVAKINWQETFGAAQEVQRQADAASECLQPCACRRWARVSRPIPK